MKLLRRILAYGRIRSARKRLNQDPSPRNYIALAQEHVRLGNTRETLIVCDEGLGAFSGNTLLLRLKERARRMANEDRMLELKQALMRSPAPELHAEVCEIHLEMECVDRAEESAHEWISWQDSGEARLMLARTRLERFFADRGRDLGQLALDSIDECSAQLQGDARPLRLKLDLLTRIGAWRDARAVVASLLEIEPGETELEGRFRTLEHLEPESPTVTRAFLEVERTGHFPGGVQEEQKKTSVAGKVRPVLRDLAKASDVEAALYMRGATVLIQGPRGATAERTARSLRSILSSGRSTARRLSLGRIFQVQLEGDFGCLTIAPGETDAGAIWSRGTLSREREETLMGLAGLNVDLEGVAS